jgi:hypothetical protein
MFPTVQSLRLAVPTSLAEFVSGALDDMKAVGRTLDTRDAGRERFTYGERTVAASMLTKLERAVGKLPVELVIDDTVTFEHPTGPTRERFRCGRGAEAAYHAFCDRHGYQLISADGAVPEDKSGYGWAWFATPDSWAAGGGVGHTVSLEAECMAATEAVLAHPDVPIAVTYDCRTVMHIGYGVTDPTVDAGRQLASVCQERKAAGLDVVWFSLSAGSRSRRQWRVDNLSGWAAQAAAAGHAPPWSADRPLPTMPRTRRRYHPDAVH